MTDLLNFSGRIGKRFRELLRLLFTRIILIQ